MGMNYYHVFPMESCPACGAPAATKDRRHIGLSAGGWVFLLHVYPDAGIKTLDDWRRVWSRPNTHIEDEYGSLVDLSEMEDRVMERSFLRKQPPDAEMLRQNNAVLGPNGLLRWCIDGERVIGHGEGTWDYCVGDFS